MTARKKKQTAALFDIQPKLNNNEKSVPSLATPRSRLKPEHLVKFTPLTQTQERMFEVFQGDQHIFADGAPGTGKTFVAIYLALQEILVKRKYSKIVVVRSIVPTRDIGFLPGSLEEKVAVYEQPYSDICRDLFVPSVAEPYKKAVAQDIITFMPTSFIRGTTINDAIIIVDEAQNLLEQEAASIITRVGRNSKLVLCGDYHQSDLAKNSEKSGYLNIKKTLQTMPSVSFISFSVSDIVRSSFVKEFIEARIKAGYYS